MRLATTNITFRKAKASDIPVVMRLLGEADFLTIGSLYDTPDYFKQSVKNGIFFVAASPEDGVIGLIHGERLMGEGAVIWYFVVDKGHRNQGIGKMLLERFENFCKKAGIKWIFGAADMNKKTVAFYKGNGYSFSGEYIEFTKNI